MKTTPVTKPIFSINNQKDRINPKPQYQRGSVWGLDKKQLLMDTILRNYDIPKFYLREIAHSKYEFEVVDGQQRLRAIWGFMENDFALGENSIDVPDLGDLRGKYYKNLSTEAQDRIGAFSLSITQLRDATDIEVRELFLRLQNGATLVPPEKRNAMFGAMRNFVHELAGHSLMSKTTKKNDRFQYDDFIAHVVALELNKGPVSVKAADLKKMYEDEQLFNSVGAVAKKIHKVINYMNKSFLDATPELALKWGFVDLYWLTSRLMSEYVIKGRHEDLRDFYLGFESDRRQVGDPADLLLSHDPWKKDLYEYIMAFQKEGAKRHNIELRHKVYKSRFLNDFADLVPKDSKRSYSAEERLIIWRRANQKCQASSCGKKVKFDKMHADHIDPHSNGGKTTIVNGQCLCIKCNLVKGGST